MCIRDRYQRRVRGSKNKQEMTNIVPLKSLDQLTSQKQFQNGKIILNFWASWAVPSKNMSAIFEELAKQYHESQVLFATVEAEEIGDITEKYEIQAVPTFIFLEAGKVVATVKGASAPELNKQIQTFAGPQTNSDSTATTPNTKEDLTKRLEDLLKQKPVMAFIKGTPEQPQCGFSNKFCNILREQKVDFGSFNILSDMEVRNGLKEYSKWPTYPQLYINGKLIGGLDILKELVEDGSFQELIPKESKILGA
eukprot:TRINITY_DN3052_c0_g2_i1.p1 TRINITY_DN3052_c0_g2~~TRINITY_DN3052_c0_g2_i1.p1  ORF type:complete len:252 (+),score=67.66 TRINITY_DN3052_c0_g2_i1:3-758(+)